MTEYWLISAPGDKTCQQTWDTMNNLTSKQNSLSVNYKFHIPDLKVGTLDQLVGLSDDLGKLDAYVEQITRKVACYLGEVLEDQRDKLHENLMANNSQTSVDGEAGESTEGGPDTPPNTPVTPCKPGHVAAGSCSGKDQRQHHWNRGEPPDSPEPPCLGQQQHHQHRHPPSSSSSAVSSSHHHQHHHHQQRDASPSQRQHRHSSHHHHHHRHPHSHCHQPHHHDRPRHHHEKKSSSSSQGADSSSYSCYQVPSAWCTSGGSSSPSSPSRSSSGGNAGSSSCCSSTEDDSPHDPEETTIEHEPSKSRPRRRLHRRPRRRRRRIDHDTPSPQRQHTEEEQDEHEPEEDDPTATGKLPNPGDLPTYVTRFQWDMAKYPIKQSLRNIADIINKQVGQIDADLKTKSTTYNNLKGSLQNLEKKQTGSLLTRNLADLVKKEHFILDSEYLATLLVIVPRAGIQDWHAMYEKLTDMIVPRSSQMITQDQEYALFTVTLFKKVIEEFKLHAREKKFIVRDFEYNEEALAAGKNELTKLATDKKKQFGPLVRWLKVNFSECFCAWIHVKALRVFVESVLRYGLPVNFQAILLRPNKKSTKRLRDVLNQLYAHLDSSATAGGSGGNQDSVDIPGLGFGQSDYFPYVYYKINVDMVDNKV
ncbi:V-type proton ATPase subunit C [Phymastichus coffea]|uniref:V-type proton ATPase subunit C n=1 Tax=Phymastichus coffea TaxID=108790 RepID=UPI00273A80AB|nr:V-type proton ATPase subunit C [Phymastichus coffea]XP_058807946.1 V-type proton ATPase subunit C [Phymastichus coffea]XP_058807947.1 V-type proton ATPase subunit C [Phymastichus coffea]